LLSNAIKFTPKNGKVQIALERVNSHIEISVRDTGIGIDSEFLKHVFDRFRQADHSTTRRYGGLGLGLAIVKHLVEQHGGTVHASSEGEALGSTFTVLLPIAAVHRTTQHELGTQHAAPVDFKLRLPIKLPASRSLSAIRHISQMDRGLSRDTTRFCIALSAAGSVNWRGD